MEFDLCRLLSQSADFSRTVEKLRHKIAERRGVAEVKDTAAAPILFGHPYARRNMACLQH